MLPRTLGMVRGRGRTTRNSARPAVSRTHTGTRVIVLVQDLDIRIVDAATGELLR